MQSRARSLSSVARRHYDRSPISYSPLDGAREAARATGCRSRPWVKINGGAKSYKVLLIASRRAICRVSISVVVDDVAVLVDFQHGLEFGVGDDVHGGPKRFSEMKFDAQVALLYQMKAGTVALIGGQVETEEGVAVSVVVASQTVPLVLPDLAGRGEQARVAPGEEVFCAKLGWKGLAGI